MTATIIIALCLLLLVAYVFDVSASKTKVPAVILLLISGWAVKQLATWWGISLPNLSAVLPILGTIGLILIVLEGALELEFNASKTGILLQSTVVALVPILALSAGLAAAFQYFGNTSFKTALTNAIPFAVISSAIAIPSVQRLGKQQREFVTYETSLSDIFGVILFNFVTLNDEVSAGSFGYFVVELVITLFITIVATLALAFLLAKSKHPIKFLPIIIMVVLVYAVTKLYHLPGLIFILLFGLFLGNVQELSQFSLIQKLQPETLHKEVHKFTELTKEIAFLVRSSFFLLFGFLIKTEELLDTSTMLWAVGVVAGIFAIRALTLLVCKQKLFPILFVAPRGLITILLFLSIPLEQSVSVANNSLVIQVIAITAFIMMFGLMGAKTAVEKT